MSQHLALTDCEYPELSDYQKSIIVGTLMGDATLSHYKGNSKNAQYILRVITVEYLEHVASQMPDWLIDGDSLVLKESAAESFENSGLPPERRGKVENYNDIYGIHSKRHPYLTELKEEWYDGREKAFPDDLSLNDTILRHWYVTDGNIRRGSENYYQVAFNSVNEAHRPEYIIDKLAEVGYECSYDGGHKFRLNGESSRRFFDAIDPVPGFEYKWPEYIFE